LKETKESKESEVFVSFDTDESKIEHNNSFSYPKPGKKAFINGKQAPTDKYRFGFMWYVHIENGKVT
jgi:hypothetical protein